jgi:DNA invertase Pin-like site-specific DNA recombinase
MIRERVLAGLARARSEGKRLGRKRLEDSDPKKVAAVISLRARGAGLRKISRELGVGVGTVIRIVNGAERPRTVLRPHRSRARVNSSDLAQ